MKFVSTIIILFLSFACAAQKGNAAQKTAMLQLRWMAGNWSGKSVALINHKSLVTNIRESVQFSLDGTILQISVKATDKDTSTNRQSLAYTSFSVISYDVKNKRYRWTSWRTNGNDYEEKTFTAGNHSFEYITEDDNRQIRYKGSVNANGEFLETGDYSKDGTSWTPFISMKLVRSR